MEKEKKHVIIIGIVLVVIAILYAFLWLIGGMFFIPLIVGSIICLVCAVCIYKCCKDRLREIEEEKNDISKY